MAQKKITELQQISEMTDGSSFPVDNGIQTYRATGSQLKTYLAPVYLPPSFERLTSGSGTWNKHYTFIVSAASATVGATYTNNSVTFTVIRTISSGNYVVMSGNGAPSASGTLTKASGTGDATIAFSVVRAPIALKVVVIGAGGGGGGAAQNGGGGGTGGTGGTSSFGTSLITCLGGVGGAQAGGQGGVGAASPTVNAPAFGIAMGGGHGNDSGGGVQNTNLQVAGGSGACSPRGGGGWGTANSSLSGGNGLSNSGSGGGGAGYSTASNTLGYSGAGGGSGAYFEGFIPEPSATYAYAVGAAGTVGSAGTGGQAGGLGGSGVVEIECIYQ